MISAIYDLALTTGANRVVRGCRIEHVCGNPALGPDKDREYGLSIIRTALKALTAVREDGLVASARLEIARPGESVRVWPVRDVVEPRVKIEGPGITYPGWFGRSIETVGRGRTHRLGGLGVVEVSSVNWHDAGGDFVDQYIDMSGPWAELIPESKLVNLCLVVEPDPAIDIHSKNEVVHRATLAVADHLARAVRDLTPPESQTYELPPAPGLPGVVYIQCVHSPQAMSHSEHTFCTGTYGMTRLTPPWLVHPNEILDGHEQPAAARAISPPRQDARLPRRDRLSYGVDDPAREGPDGRAGREAR